MNDNKRHLWQSLYETILKKIESAFPDWLKNTHNQDRLEKYQDAAIDVALGFSDMAVYGEYKNCTELDLYESQKTLHKSGIKTPKMPYGKLSEQRIEEFVINEHSVDRAVLSTEAQSRASDELEQAKHNRPFIQYKSNPFIEAGNTLKMFNETEIFLQNELHKCYIEDNDLWDYKGHDYQTAIQNNEPRISSEWIRVYCDNIIDIYEADVEIDVESIIEKMGAYTPLGAKSDLYHAFAQLDGLYSRIQDVRPDYIPKQCGELVSNIINHWQEKNIECPLTSEQIISQLDKLKGHHIEFEINRFSKESTFELSEHGAMSQIASETETNKTHIVLLPQDATDKLLSLRSQLSSAINEIDAVVGKNGQVQQNISTHEKQANEITQSRDFSGPTL